MLFKTLALLFLVSGAFASLPAQSISCGGQEFTVQQIQDAIQAGYQHEQSDEKISMLLSCYLK